MEKKERLVDYLNELDEQIDALLDKREECCDMLADLGLYPERRENGW